MGKIHEVFLGIPNPSAAAPGRATALRQQDIQAGGLVIFYNTHTFLLVMIILKTGQIPLIKAEIPSMNVTHCNHFYEKFSYHDNKVFLCKK